MSDAFEAAGLDGRLSLGIDAVRWEESVLVIEATLRFQARYPLCCASLACYLPAFRPQGLASIAQELQAGELLDEAPPLQVSVTLSVPDGFEFEQRMLGAADGTVQVYDHP